MSYLKSYVATATVSPRSAEKFLRAVFGEPVRLPERARTVSHPALVKAKSGDGIGFDTGDCIAVTDAKNNVKMLLKANCKEPFEKHGPLTVAKRGVTNVNDLVPGHTYIVHDDDSFAFVKYLGFSMVLTRRLDSCDIVKLDGNRIPPCYELSLPVEK